MVFDSWTAEGVGVAPLNVRALEVLALSAVAFLRSAVPPRLVSTVPPSVCVARVESGIVGWTVYSRAGSSFRLHCVKLGTGVQFCPSLYRDVSNTRTTLASRVAQLPRLAL